MKQYFSRTHGPQAGSGRGAPGFLRSALPSSLPLSLPPSPSSLSVLEMRTAPILTIMETRCQSLAGAEPAQFPGDQSRETLFTVLPLPPALTRIGGVFPGGIPIPHSICKASEVRRTGVCCSVTEGEGRLENCSVLGSDDNSCHLLLSHKPQTAA